jgi:hypothetical protein
MEGDFVEGTIPWAAVERNEGSALESGILKI